MKNKKISFIILFVSILLFIFMISKFLSKDSGDFSSEINKFVSDDNVMYYENIPVIFENILFENKFLSDMVVNISVIDIKDRALRFDDLREELEKFSIELLVKTVKKM